MLLFIDTETTGLPKNWKAPVEDVANWPRLVQVAWLEYSADGELLATESHIIKPNGFTIPAESTAIHGITTEAAHEKGVPLLPILQHLHHSLADADVVVAHNIAFDENILGAEFIRHAMSNPLPGKERLCTMLSSTSFCRLPGKYNRYKWPTLVELHTILFGSGYEGVHDALADINATAACYWELRNRGIM